MKYLVTGAAGFLGRVLVRRMLEQGIRDIRLLVRRDVSPWVQQLKEAFAEARIETHFASLLRPEALVGCERDVDMVFHLAAGSSGAPADLFLNTVVASRNLLDLLVRVPAARLPKVVLVSSLSVYGLASLPRGASVNEETPLEAHPERRDPYAQAKVLQELLFREYQRRHGFGLVVVRPGAVYGTEDHLFTNLLGIRISNVLIQFGGSNVVPITHVENCADGLIAASRTGATVSTYNVVDDDLPSCKKYLEAIRPHINLGRSISVPWFLTLMLSASAERYHRWSRGQIPNALTPYKARSLWGGHRFSNEKLKSIGWCPARKTLLGASTCSPTSP